MCEQQCAGPEINTTKGAGGRTQRGAEVYWLC